MLLPKDDGLVGTRPDAASDQIAEFKRRIFSDFPFFVRALFRNRGLDKHSPLSEIELDMLDYAANGPRLRGVLAFRGLGKTTAITAPLTVFRGIRDFNRQVIITSKSLGEAKKTVSLIRDWIDTVWFLRELTPRSGQRDASTYFDFGPAKEDRQPSVSAIGVEGQLEGNRGHTIQADDVETKGNTKTIEARSELRKLVSEFTNILYPDTGFRAGTTRDPVEIVYEMTPKHDETLCQKLPRFLFRAYPIVYPRPDQKVINPAPIITRRLQEGKNKPGDPVLPHRFGEEEIADRMANGQAEFDREFMLIADLSAQKVHPLRLSDLIIMDVPRDVAPMVVEWGTQNHNGSTARKDIPILGYTGDCLYGPIIIGKETAKYQGTKGYLDPAGRGEDESGLSILSMLAGRLWGKCVEGHQGGSETPALERIALTLRRHNCRELYIEDNFGRGMFQQLLEPVLQKFFLQPGEDPAYPDGWTCSCTSRNASGIKEERIIDILEPVMSTRRLILDPSCVIPEPGVDVDYQLQHQMATIRRVRKCLVHEDRLESLAGCVKEWQDGLRISPERAVARLRERQIEEEDRRQWQEMGGQSHDPSWIALR